MRKQFLLFVLFSMFFSKMVLAYDIKTHFPVFVLSNVQYNIAIFNGKTHQWLKNIDLTLYANDFYLRNDGKIIVRNVGLAHQGNAGLAVIDSQKNKVLQQLPYDNPMESDIFYDQPGLALFTSGLAYRFKGMRAGILDPISLKLEHEFWTEGWIKGARLEDGFLWMYIVSFLKKKPQFFQKYNLKTQKTESQIPLKVKYRRGIFDDKFFYGIDEQKGTVSAVRLSDQTVAKTVRAVFEVDRLLNMKWYQNKIMVLAKGAHSSSDPGVLIVIDPKTFEVEHYVELNGYPTSLCGYPEIKKLFVSNDYTNTISVVDTEFWSVIDTVSSKVSQPTVVRCFLPDPAG